MNKLMIGVALAALAAGCSTDKVHELMRSEPWGSDPNGGVGVVE